MRVLHAVHDFLPRHRAGAEIYALRLCQALALRHDIAILCAEYDPSRAHGSVVERTYQGLPVHELINNWAFTSFADTYRSAHLGAALRDVLSRVRPDVLHVHNLLNLSFELPQIAKTQGISVVATLHDYTLVCPSGGQRVHVADSHVCRAIDPARCARCFSESPFHGQLSVRAHPNRRAPTWLYRLARSAARHAPWTARLLHRALSFRAPSLDARVMAERLSYASRVFDAVDVFVAPSPSLAREYERLGIPAHKLRVSDYGFRPLAHAPQGSPRAERSTRKTGQRLRLGFVGTPVWHKGVHVLIEACRALARDTYELFVFGDLETFPDYSAKLRALAHGHPIHFGGAFNEDEADGVYAAFDVLVVPSLWLENSPLVIHEAFLAGVPVVGANIGGISDLIEHEKNGLLYEAYSSQALAGTLGRLIEERGLLERLSRGIPAVKSIEDDAAWWQDIYQAVCSPPHTCTRP